MSRRFLSVDPPDLEPLADGEGARQALARAGAARHPRARLRLRLQRALAGDPDRRPARDRQLDRADERPPRPRSGRTSSIVVVLALVALRHQLHAPLRDRAHRHPRRGAHARAALPGVPALPARVLRPARDRPGRLARDERPLPHPLLHRLGHDPGDPVADDDRRDRGRPLPRQREARRDRADRDAVRRRARVHVRAAR